jgi:hypothetical protein
MARGDVVAGSTMVDSTHTCTIRPANGTEWCINNIYYDVGGGTLSFNIVDTDNSITTNFDTDTADGGKLGGCFHLSYAHYMTITGSSTADSYVSYDGIVIKQG